MLIDTSLFSSEHFGKHWKNLSCNKPKHNNSLVKFYIKGDVIERKEPQIRSQEVFGSSPSSAPNQSCDIKPVTLVSYRSKMEKLDKIVSKISSLEFDYYKLVE